MINIDTLISYFKEVGSSLKVQISAAITFGTALILVWTKNSDNLKITLTILFLFPALMFIFSLLEKLCLFIKKERQQQKLWSNLTPEEVEFISYYVKNNTKTRYMTANNGTYQDSGIINPLIAKNILYIASSMSEFRGESRQSMRQQFPINIQDKAFGFFTKKLKK